MTCSLDELERSQNERNDRAENRVLVLMTKLTRMENAIYHSEQERRRLLDEVMQLKGNIRSHVTVLPSSGSSCIRADKNRKTVIIEWSGKRKVFHFDSVFDPCEYQTQKIDRRSRVSGSVPKIVFRDVEDYIQSVLDGFQVCLMSQGPTDESYRQFLVGGRCKPMREVFNKVIQRVYLAFRRIHSKDVSVAI